MSADAVAFFDDDHNPPEPAALVRPEVPGDIPRGRSGRPKIRSLADPEVLVEYTRASSLGDVLEDMYAINLRQLRMVVYAVAHDPALRARAQAVPTFTEQADKRALKEISETALTLCRASTGADRGTALHQLSERWDQDAEIFGLDSDLAEGLRRYAQLMEGFAVIASETFVVCDELEAAGSFDRVVTPRWPMTAPNGIVIEPGDRLVVDLKTGAEAKYFGPCYAVQQAVYAWGMPYHPDLGRVAWGAEGLVSGPAPRRDWSLLLHIPIDHPEDSALWWVDLVAGMELARLAALARKVRRRAGMFLPAEPPAPSLQEAAELLPYDVPILETDDCPDAEDREPEDEAGATLDGGVHALGPRSLERRERTILGLIQAARTSADLVKIWERYGQGGWTPACGAAADARLVTLRVMS